MFLVGDVCWRLYQFEKHFTMQDNRGGEFHNVWEQRLAIHVFIP